MCVCGRGPSFFVLGSVGKATGNEKNLFTYYAKDANLTSGWPTVRWMKLKVLMVEEDQAHTKKTFVGSIASRRQPKALAHRSASARRRAAQIGQVG